MGELKRQSDFHKLNLRWLSHPCHTLMLFAEAKLLFNLDGYTVSDVVMYWRDEPVVGVEVSLTFVSSSAPALQYLKSFCLCYLTRKIK